MGRLLERLLDEARAVFPWLAPFDVIRDRGRDSWMIRTRAGAFEFTEQVAQTRAQLVEFVMYQLHQLQRRAEQADRERLGAPMYLPNDALQPRYGERIALHVGDRIRVNGHETRVVAIGRDEITVERLDLQREAEQLRILRQMQRAALFGEYLPQYGPITREAEQRSIELLRRNLTPEQLRMWDSEQAIEVRGGDTGICYRIRGTIASFNIDRLGEGGGRLCCTPGQPGDLPLGDYVLGQKLALEHDEARFVGEANVHVDYRAFGL